MDSIRCRSARACTSPLLDPRRGAALDSPSQLHRRALVGRLCSWFAGTARCHRDLPEPRRREGSSTPTEIHRDSSSAGNQATRRPLLSDPPLFSVGNRATRSPLLPDPLPSSTGHFTRTCLCVRIPAPGARGDRRLCLWLPKAACQINLMCIRQGHLECLLEYLDFPDEKKTWTRLYKVPPGNRKRKSSETRMIMVRPTFPLWYLEHEKPDQLPKANVVAIVSSPWKVGDLIEWWYTDCYWTGKIIELLGDDKVKIALHEEPIGEGGYYDADCKDLRPALDWSLEKGWSVPLSQENGKSWYTAQLIIQSTDSGSSCSDEDIEQCCDGEEVQKCLDGPSDVPAEAMGSGTKLLANVSNEIFINNQGDGKEESPECLNGSTSMPQEVTNSKGDLPPNQNGHCCIESETKSPIAKRGEPPEALSDGQSSPIRLKRQKTFRDSSVEAPPDTVDDAIMELETVANKIKRLESLVLSAGPPPSKIAKLSWKFLEDASAKHK